MRTLIALFTLVVSTTSYAYKADCDTDNGRSFQIMVENKVLTVDYKYDHYYQGKTWLGWYEYSNSKYTYKTGSFEKGGFPIEVINSRGQVSNGRCDFR